MNRLVRVLKIMVRGNNYRAACDAHPVADLQAALAVEHTERVDRAIVADLDRPPIAHQHGKGADQATRPDLDEGRLMVGPYAAIRSHLGLLANGNIFPPFE